MTGRARNDAPRGQLPKTHEELQAIVDRTWQQACDAEFARADEEYRFMRAAVLAFDEVLSGALDGSSSWTSGAPPRLQGCSPEAAATLAARFRSVLSEEKRLKALDAFEKATGVTIDDPGLARLSAETVRALREGCGQFGLVSSRLRLALEQIDSGCEAISGVASRMERVLAHDKTQPALCATDSVDKLKVTSRVKNALDRAGVRTIGDLCCWKPIDLLNLKNFGYTSLSELQDCLAELGLTLKKDA